MEARENRNAAAITELDNMSGLSTPTSVTMASSSPAMSALV
jgi:hypothetical protein